MIEKFDVSLRIMGKDIHPDKISKELDLIPDISYGKGDTHIIYSGGVPTKRVWDKDMWSKTFYTGELGFEESLEKIMQHIRSNKECFVKYRELGYKMDVFCGIWYDDKTDKVILPQEIMDAYEELGIIIDLDEYWL